MKREAEGSLLTQFKRNLKYLKSPVYLVTVFIAGNFLLNCKGAWKPVKSGHYSIYHRKFQHGLVTKCAKVSLLWIFIPYCLKIFQRFNLSVSWRGFGNLYWVAVRVRIDACADCNFDLSYYRIYLWYDDVSLEKLQTRIQGSYLCSPCIYQPYLSLGFTAHEYILNREYRVLIETRW